MAFAAVAALFTAEAVTATMVLSAVAEVGAVMTVVGVVTKSKELTKIGGIMALVGGVGSLISGAVSGATAAGAEAAAGAAAGEVAAGASAEALASSAGALESGLAPGVLEVGAEAAMSIPEAAAAAQTMAPPPTPQAAPVTPGIAEPAALPDLGPTVGETTGSGLQEMRDISSIPQAPTGAEAPISPVEMNPNDQFLKAGTKTTPPTDSKTFWGNLTDFAKKNETWLKGGLSGLSTGYQADQRNNLYSRELDQRQQRINYGNQVANYTPGIVAGAIR